MKGATSGVAADAGKGGSWTLRGVRALDPLDGTDGVRDVFCVDGVFADAPAAGAPQIDGSGLVAMPAAIDLHVHFREPGGEGAETVATGLAAAAAGGFGLVVAMPNVDPPLDTPERVRAQCSLAAAAAEKRVALRLAGCCSAGRAGRAEAPLEALAEAGAAAFSDDGAMVDDDGLMRRVMLRAAALGLPVMDHAVRPALARGGVVRRCALAAGKSLAVFPDEAETAAVARDVALARETGAALHLQHLSCAESVRLVAEARRCGGIRLSCEATPHHLLLCAEEIPGDDASWKMNPPLGLRSDREALRKGVLDGTICAFATDHAPHVSEAKARGFAGAPFGCIGLETALAATWKAMVEESGMRPVDWAARWTAGPASVLGLPAPGFRAGTPAKVALLRPGRWVPAPGDLKSKSRNCPFLGMPLPIRVEALLA